MQRNGRSRVTVVGHDRWMRNQVASVTEAPTKGRGNGDLFLVSGTRRETNASKSGATRAHHVYAETRSTCNIVEFPADVFVGIGYFKFVETVFEAHVVHAAATVCKRTAVANGTVGRDLVRHVAPSIAARRLHDKHPKLQHQILHSVVNAAVFAMKSFINCEGNR